MVDNLYIHIPFCARKCIYCDFFSVPFDRDQAAGYIKALCHELDLKKELSGTLKSVYIGGGTPTLLDEASLTGLFDCLRNHYSFSASPEITMEANPGSSDASIFKLLRELGVNRLSIGIQSFNDAELKTLKRVHSSEEAVRAYESASEAGIRNISIDLIYGIPGQTLSSWKESLFKACSLSPSHISTYELTPEKNTPLFNSIRAGTMAMPSEEVIIEMYYIALEYLGSRGFNHYEISNFALPGHESIHNLNYWDRGEYIGAGAGAHSFIGSHRMYNTSDLTKYVRDLSTDTVPEEKSVVTHKEAVEEFIFLGLRTTKGISLSRAEVSGLNIMQSSIDLMDQGYLEQINGHIKLTKKGLIVSNMVIVKLLDALGL